MNPDQNDCNKQANFTVSVNNVIFSVDTQANRLLVLLVKNFQPASANIWGLPETFVRQGESLQTAAQRILAEKIWVKNLYLEQLYTFDQVNTDLSNISENSQVNSIHLAVSYFALVRYEDTRLMADQVNSIAWHDLEKLPDLVSGHQSILAYGYQRLHNKLEYSPVAFDVLPELFTLGELYQFYTIVLGENFSDYSNFRSRLLKLGFLRDTHIKVSRGAGRPASLYRFDAIAFDQLKDKPLVFI
jgi:ADP-ribose pyrophosphatase YjhB (NUDIX family)